MRTPSVRPFLTTRGLVPENQESPVHYIIPETTEPRFHFRRNHFAYPSLSPLSYWLQVEGHVENPLWFSLQDLLALPAVTVPALLECAGNKRGLFEPVVYGEQWEKGAISQGYWTGVPLKTLLEKAVVKEGAAEVVTIGMDRGKRPGTEGSVSFARSLPLEKATHEDTIIAYAYNDRSIPFKMGYPLRLIVPGWYAMASVKWLRQIRVSEESFTGPYQTEDYVCYPDKDSDEGAFPVTEIKLDSSILQPMQRAILPSGSHTIHGIAWSSTGVIARIYVSTDGGTSWSEAELDPEQVGYHWTRWSMEWLDVQPGNYTILSKAVDASGAAQPETAFWNRNGYGYNAVDRVEVKVEE
ncbi:sulfite oxidase [Alteribacter lacisalsi]|uniref:Sulfite oxidase n=1 Tax=Alteribacter lacisalsi TaxID=2045244 RepID=A0A2W0H3J0_9BACI|nr:sulfite oxidase [Alteribacter lacisalsi]PYZ96403.1 sulfite oxidase [Alteribacter lacisalsi]